MSAAFQELVRYKRRDRYRDMIIASLLSTPIFWLYDYSPRTVAFLVFAMAMSAAFSAHDATQMSLFTVKWIVEGPDDEPTASEPEPAARAKRLVRTTRQR